jgi:pectinesterase
VREERNIPYCRVAVRSLLLDAFYPAEKTAAARPAVIIIYGGGWRSGDRSQHYPLAQRLAALQYVCFTPEYRLSTEALYPAAVYDLKSAIRWVKANAVKYEVDTNKIGVLGFSAGGELAAFLGATGGIPQFEGNGGNNGPSTQVQAVIDLDGTLSFVHPESGEGDDSKHTSAATYWLGYPKKDNPALWKEASPLTWTGQQTPPTLFVNSSVDRMHAGRDDYRRLLEGYGVVVEVHSFAGAPHPFPLFTPWFDPMVGYIDGFLKKVFFP